MKVTKTMITRAENNHFRKEDYPSLQKQNALQAVYYKQQGDKKTYRVYAKLVPKSMISKIEGKADRKVQKKTRRTSSPFGVSIRMPKFSL